MTVGIIAVVALVVAAPSWAAAPASGSVGPTRSATGWTGQSFAAGATTSPSLCGSSDTLCDHYSVSVGATSSYWSTHTGAMGVSIHWGSASNNFDLYVYSGGTLVGSSASGSSTGERVTVSNPTGSYSVVVVPKLVTNSGYTGSVSFSSQAKPTPPTSPQPAPSPTGNGGGGGNGNGNGGGNGGGPTGGGGLPTGGGGLPTGGGGLPTGGTNPGGTNTGGTTSGGQPPGGGVIQPGSTPPFGSPSGPVFNYRGPYHFKPPFTIGDNPGGAVMPPQGGTVRVPPGSNAGGGHAVMPPGSSSSGRPTAPSSNPVQPVQIRTAGATPGKHLPSLLWFLLPLGLLLAVVIARVVFDDDGPATATATAAPTAAVSAADRSAFERDEAPHVGPFTMVALAVGRLIRRRAT